MWRASQILLLACPILLSFPSLAQASIRRPKIEELVNSADLVVIGNVTSVRATPPELYRQIAMTVVIGVAVVVAGVLIWRRRWSALVVLAALSLLGIALFDAPFDTYRKVAFVSVSSTVCGATPAAEIPVYYQNGFVCDVTTFAAGREYLLFLKEVSSGYTLSWYDWGEWTIEDGLVQTERRTWGDAAPPIPLTEFMARIKRVRSEQEKR